MKNPLIRSILASLTFAALSLPSASVPFSLSQSGACPGAITLTVTSSTPNRLVVFFYGRSGSFVKPTMPCQGLALGISQPRVGALFAADASGTAVISFSSPSGICGLSVQAVDVSACAATNVIVL